MQARLALWMAAALVGATTAAHAEPADPLEQWLAARGQPPTTTAAPVERSRMAELVVAAMNFVGVPYRLGGNDADAGFDCSGFTRHLFQLNLGLALPRRSHEQASAQGFVNVPRRELQPGDLVFFNTLKRTFSHVGIYVGEGRFIHSPRPGASVRLEDMQSSYWQRRFDGGRRVALFAEAPLATAQATQAAQATPTAAAVPAARPYNPTDLFGPQH